MAILNPPPKTLGEILGTDNIYKVPIYQRSFSWGKDEAEELWNDLADNTPPYFLGIILLKDQLEKSNTKFFEVIDGQQRLATLLLLLRAGVEVLDITDDDRIKLQNFITKQGFAEDKEKFTLELNKRDNLKFKTLLNDKTTYAPEDGRKRYSSWKNQEQVKNYFLTEFNKIKARSGPNGVKEFIKDSVLSLTMLSVHLQDESDVFLFFETLNDRGMDLSLADLVKNHVCHVCSDPDYGAQKIDIISDLLGTGKMKPFLLHYCWAQSDDDPLPPTKDLMNWYSQIIKVEKDLFLKNLEEYANIYYEFLEPRKSSKSQSREVLINLKDLGATRCYPVLMVGKKCLTAPEFNQLCKAIEILTVRHSTITKQDAKELEEFYKNIAREIRNGVDFEKILAKLKDQSEQISTNLFKTSFGEYEPENGKVAKYILLKIENYLSGKANAGLDWDTLNLEHIIAKKGIESEENYEYLEKLGNMTLLSEHLNKSVSNKPYPQKKEEYKRDTKIKLTQDLVDNYPEFTKESVIIRQEKLTEIALKVWDPENIQ